MPDIHNIKRGESSFGSQSIEVSVQSASSEAGRPGRGSITEEKELTAQQAGKHKLRKEEEGCICSRSYSVIHFFPLNFTSQCHTQL